MNFKNIPKRLLLLLLFPFSMLLFHFTSYTPGFIENIYSKGINKLLIEFLSLITGFVPFSLAEIFLILLSIAIPIYLIFMTIRILKQQNHKLKAFLYLVINISIAVSLTYFILTTAWSLNYNRFPFSKIAKLDITPASVDELAGLCDKLIVDANNYRSKVLEDPKGLMTIPKGYAEVFQNADKGFKIAATSLPVFRGTYGKPKAVIFSKGMSYSGIIGLYCPFTGEANIDVAIPAFSIPSTTCHEMAHQHGFAREDEANYISWLTCNANPDSCFKYSGTMLALINSMNALYSHNKEKYFALNKKLSAGVVRDLNANNLYWKKHKGPVEKVTTSLNDAYLKANRQEDGVYSYGRMVDLLLAEYRKNKILIKK